MAVTKITIEDAVSRMCRIDGPAIIEENLTPYINDAVAQYSRDKPLLKVEDVTGGGANLCDTPASWVDGGSVISKIVYPYVDEDSSVIEEDGYEPELQTDGTDKIRFLGYSPAATETVRVWFSLDHTVSDTACTVYARDESALAHLVAAKIETAKASYFLGLKDHGADLVDYGAKANEARALSRMHFDAYKQGLGISEGGGRAAAVAGDLDTDPQYPGISHQTHHNRRWR